MNYGKTIRDIRKSMGISQGTLARKLGVTQGYLSKVEKSSQTPSISLLEDISDQLSISFSILVWLSVEDEDIPDDRVKPYRQLKSSIDALVHDFMAEVQLPKIEK